MRPRNAHTIMVRTSKGMMEPFDSSRIAQSLRLETGITDPVAAEIAKEVEIEIRHLDLEFVSAPLIREIVNVKLLERGLEEERKTYTRVGLPVVDVDRMITGKHWYSKENANLQQNPETVHKLVADSVIREYSLLRTIPTKLGDMHMRGAIHIHELEYFPTRPFCQSHDARFFFRNGFIADGTGTHTAVAGPAKKAEVALLHALKVLQASQVNCGGGQGLHDFNVFMAPYLTGMKDEALRQLAQMMFFELGEMYVARGGQTVFSSVSLEPRVPKTYVDIPAIGPKGQVVGKYGDFEDEVARFFNAIMDVAFAGDYMGKPFNWPKLEVRLAKEWLEKCEEQYLRTSKLAAKFGGTYYFNASVPYMPGEMVCTQCCRFYMQHASWNDDRDLENGTLRGGVIQNITINVPQAAYEANGSDEKLFEGLRWRMDAARDIAFIKINEIKKRLVGGFLPFLAQPVDREPYKMVWQDLSYDSRLRIEGEHAYTFDGRPYLEPDRQGVTIGVLGINEMLKAHTGSEIHESKESWKFGLKTVEFMRRVVDEYTRENRIYFGLVQSPAESCAVRLAQIDLARFGEKAVVQGDLTKSENGVPAVYYTNSTHLNVGANVPLGKRIQIEASFHPLFNGGTIMHIFMGEAYPEEEALWRLTKHIANKTLTGYFAYTKDMTICKTCKQVSYGLLDKCPNCNAEGAALEHWSRITGYYQEVSGWNAGKKQELKNRHRYVITDEAKLLTS